MIRVIIGMADPLQWNFNICMVIVRAIALFEFCIVYYLHFCDRI